MLLCFGKDCCASGKFLVFWKRLLCSRIDCCVLEKIVVFSKRLLGSSKDCCVSEQELSCVLPVWATVCKDYSQELLHFNRKQLEKCYVKKHQPYQPKPVAAETVDPNKTRPNQVIFSLVLVL